MASEAKKLIELEFGGNTKPIEDQLDALRAKILELRKALATKQKSDALTTLELQAKAGIIPLSKLRDEITKTVREAVKAKGNRAEFVNDQEILQNIIRLKQLKAEMEAVGNASQDVESKASKIGNALQSAFLPLAGISAGITALLATSSKSFADFERTLNTIKAVSNVTNSELAQIKQESLDLGQSTIFSNQQVAESYLELSKAGFSAQESTQALPGLLQLAAAAGGDLGIATQAVAESMRSFGLSTEETSRFMDVLAQSANNSSVDIGDMVMAFKQVAPVAKETKQSVEDISALLAVLGNNGVKAGDAGSDLRNIVTNLLKPTKEAAGVLKELNLTLKDQQGNVKSLSQFFKEANAALKPYNDSSRAAAASILVGQENLKSFLILSGQAPGTIDEMVASLNNAEGASKRMADTINQGLFSSLEQLSGSFDTLKTTLGEAIAPAIQTVAGLLTRLNTLLSQNRILAQFTAGFLAAVAAVTALGAAFSGLLLTLGPTVLALRAVGFSLGGVALAVAGLGAVVGVLTVAMNEARESSALTNRSVAELEQTIKSTAQETVNSTKQYQAMAQGLDKLAQKTKLTANEKKKLAFEFDELQKRFPTLEGSIESLIAKYGSLEKAILSARIQEAALTNGKAIDDQIERLDNEIRAKESFAKRKTNFFTTISDEERKTEQANIENLRKQRAAAVKERENLSIRLVEMFKKEAEATNVQNNETVGGKNLNLTSENASREAEKIAKARQQLKQKLAQIEVEITGFTKGEFAKRREDARRSYDEELANIEKLRLDGKLSKSEVTKELDAAARLLNARMVDIAKQQKQAFKESANALAEIRANIDSLNASATQLNPFDDIAADAQKAGLAIERDYAQKLDRLREDARTGRIKPELVGTYKADLDKEKSAAQKNQQEITAQKITEALNAQELINARIEVLTAELAGKQRDIIAKSNDLLITELEQTFKRASENNDKAQLALSENQSVLNQQWVQTAISEFLQASGELSKAKEEKAKALAAFDSKQQQDQVDAIQQQIDLEGRRPDLIAKLIASYDELLARLNAENEITSQTAEKRAEIQAIIKDSSFAQAGLRAETNSFGKALNTLSRLNFGNSQFGNFFSGIIGGLENVNTAFEAFKGKPENAGKGFLSFFKSAEGFSSRQFGLQAGTQAIQLIAQQLGRGKSKVGQALGGALSGALAGASFGSAILPGIGTAVGAIGGALFGATSSSSSDSFLGRNKGKILGGLLGGPLGFLFGANADKRRREVERQQKIADQLVNKALTGADPNNINDLTSRLGALLRNNKGLTGSRVKQISEASNQLRAAIAERQKVITLAVDDLKYQNQILSIAFKEFDDLPIENIKLQREVDLLELQNETKKAMDQFKDSVEAQNLIQQNAELKRQAILKSSTIDIINAVIEEQNKIRALRAQTAIDEARVGGNAVEIINAELQARLVAIDNDIASFQGAEETKTEFLRQKSAERNAILKDAQTQVDDLLQQGLDILNEGLVVGETKADSQAKRLGKLFGNLNPFGLLQNGGDLLQKNVTIGSGGIQFLLQGINDAEALIAQIKTDPIIQAKLLAALNQAITRAT